MPLQQNVFEAFMNKVMKALEPKVDPRDSPDAVEDNTAVPTTDAGQLPTDAPNNITR